MKIDQSGFIAYLKNSISLLNLTAQNVGKNSIKVAGLLIVFGIHTVFYGRFKLCGILLGQY